MCWLAVFVLVAHLLKQGYSLQGLPRLMLPTRSVVLCAFAALSTQHPSWLSTRASPLTPTHQGVIVMAATNLPETLDPALKRPGRFDRHVAVPLPDVRGRAEILRYYMQGKPFAADVDADLLARQTSGFSGAGGCGQGRGRGRARGGAYCLRSTQCRRSACLGPGASDRVPPLIPCRSLSPASLQPHRPSPPSHQTCQTSSTRPRCWRPSATRPPSPRRWSTTPTTRWARLAAVKPSLTVVQSCCPRSPYLLPTHPSPRNPPPRANPSPPPFTAFLLTLLAPPLPRS